MEATDLMDDKVYNSIRTEDIRIHYASFYKLSLSELNSASIKLAQSCLQENPAGWENDIKVSYKHKALLLLIAGKKAQRSKRQLI